MLDDGEIERRVRLIRPMEQPQRARPKMMAESHWAGGRRDGLRRGVDSRARRGAGVRRQHDLTSSRACSCRSGSGCPNESTRVYRLQTDDGERIIGRKVSPAWVGNRD